MRATRKMCVKWVELFMLGQIGKNLSSSDPSRHILSSTRRSRSLPPESRYGSWCWWWRGRGSTQSSFLFQELAVASPTTPRATRCLQSWQVCWLWSLACQTVGSGSLWLLWEVQGLWWLQTSSQHSGLTRDWQHQALDLQFSTHAMLKTKWTE